MKQNFEIKRFLTGIISSPSASDIPPDAASYSLNVDPTVEDGKLGGIPTDSTKQSTLDASSMGLLDDGGNWNLIYYDSSVPEIAALDDFYTTPSAASITGTTSVSPSIAHPPIQVWNKAAHIGLGPDENDPPKWIGYIDDGQFGGSAPSGLQIMDAECAAPVISAGFHKVVFDGTNILAIVFGGDRVYKLDTSGDVVSTTDVDAVVLNHTSALCLDGTDVWVYDSTGTTTGRILKIQISDMSLQQTNPVEFSVGGTGLTNDFNGGSITDMEVTSATSDLVWVAAHAPGVEVDSTKMDVSPMLCVGAKPAAAGITVTFGNTRPGMATGTAAGEWSDGPTFYTNPLCLFKTEDATDDVIGIVYKIGTGTIYNGTPATEIFDGSTCFFILSDSSSISGACVGTGAGEGGFFRILGVSLETNGLTGLQRSTASTEYLVCGHVSSLGSNSLTTLDASSTAIWTSGSGSAWNGAAVYQVASTDTDLSLVDVDRPCICVTADAGSGNIYGFSSTGSRIFFTATLSPSFGTLSFDLKGDVAVDVVESDRTDGSLTDAARYRYKLSFVYDGAQESPLSEEFVQVELSTTTEDNHVVAITPKLIDYTNLNKRITAVNVYQALGSEFGALSYYRLIASLDVTAGEFYDSTLYTPSATLKAAAAFSTDTGGVTFSASSGLPEDLKRSIVHYGLSHNMNGEMIVGQCWIPDVADSERWVVKSLPGKLDSFNTVDDFTQLKAVPTAVTGWNNRFYAFDKSRIYRINPNPFVIEDTFDGVGCIGSEAVVPTEYGIFFADASSIYQHDGRAPRDIGYAIKDLWAARVTTTVNPKMLYDPTRRCVLLFFAIAGPEYRVLVYSLVHQGWWYWQTNNPQSILLGRDKEILLSDGTDLLEYLGGASYRNYAWVSKDITLGNDSIKKRFFSTRVQAEGTGGTWPGTIGFVADGSTVTPTTDHDGETFRYIHPVWAEKFKISVDTMPGDDLIDSFGINYRSKVVAG